MRRIHWQEAEPERTRAVPVLVYDLESHSWIYPFTYSVSVADTIMSTEDLELGSIERQLKDWFLTRRVLMERTTALKRLFTEHNVTGLTGKASTTASARERVLWDDLTQSRPAIEETLSLNARNMKADMYLHMFKTATSLDHPCREPGVSYLMCLKDHTQDDTVKRDSVCNDLFKTFSVCRTSVINQQADSLRSTLAQQQQHDNYAAQLWNRRAELLAQISSSSS